MLKVTCDCGANYTVREELAGKKGRCKKCGSIFVIPAPPEPEQEAHEDEYAMIEAAPPLAAPAMAVAAARRSGHGHSGGGGEGRGVYAPPSGLPREAHDPSREMSKALYVGGYIVGIAILPVIGFMAGLTEGDGGDPPPAFFVLMLLALPLMLLPVFCMGLLTYRMWEAIQDDHARCRPGSATILLFVPLVNLFWIFKAWGGWAEDYHGFCRRHNFKGTQLNDSLGTWVGGLYIVSLVPILNLLSIFNLVLIPMFMSQAVDGVNALLREGHRPQRGSVKGMGIGSMIYGAFGVITLGIMGAIGLVLGIMGLIAGRSRDGEAAPGRGWVVGGIGVSLAGMMVGVALIIWLVGGALTKGMETAQMARNMSTGQGLVTHVVSASFVLGHIPPADQWYEPVEQSGDNRDIEGDEGHVYAMNALLGGVPLDRIERAEDTVLFFEAAAGSGISGGRDLLPMFPEHRDDGFLVVFADGAVRTIPSAEEVRRLTWTPVLKPGGADEVIPAAASREVNPAAPPPIGVPPYPGAGPGAGAGPGFIPPPPPPPYATFEAGPGPRDFAPPLPPPRTAEEARQRHEQLRAEMEARAKRFREESERRAAEARARFEQHRNETRQRQSSQP